MVEPETDEVANVHEAATLSSAPPETRAGPLAVRAAVYRVEESVDARLYAELTNIGDTPITVDLYDLIRSIDVRRDDGETGEAFGTTRPHRCLHAECVFLAPQNSVFFVLPLEEAGDAISVRLGLAIPLHDPKAEANKIREIMLVEEVGVTLDLPVERQTHPLWPPFADPRSQGL